MNRTFRHSHETKKSQFRLNDDPNGNWFDFEMNGELTTIQFDSLTFNEKGKTFIFKK